MSEWIEVIEVVSYTYLTAQVYLVYILIRHSHRKSNNLKVKSCISFCLLLIRSHRRLECTSTARQRMVEGKF